MSQRDMAVERRRRRQQAAQVTATVAEGPDGNSAKALRLPLVSQRIPQQLRSFRVRYGGQGVLDIRAAAGFLAQPLRLSC